MSRPANDYDVLHYWNGAPWLTWLRRLNCCCCALRLFSLASLSLILGGTLPMARFYRQIGRCCESLTQDSVGDWALTNYCVVLCPWCFWRLCDLILLPWGLTNSLTNSLFFPSDFFNILGAWLQWRLYLGALDSIFILTSSQLRSV